MNYGKDEVARKLRQINSRAEKVQTKFILFFLKLIFIVCSLCVILGASLGYGVFKGILDSAPEIDGQHRAERLCHNGI